MMDVVSSCLSLIKEIHSWKILFEENNSQHARIKGDVECLYYTISSLKSPYSGPTISALSQLELVMKKIKALAEQYQKKKLYSFVQADEDVALSQFRKEELEEISERLEKGKNSLALALTADETNVAIRISENLGIVKNIMEDRLDTAEETLFRKTTLETLEVPLETLKIFDNFKMGECGYGSVVMGKWKQRDVAIKRITCDTLNDANCYREIENEVLVMNALASEISQHPRILLCFGYAKGEVPDQMNLILELAPYGSFGSLLQDTVNFDWLPPLMCLAWGLDMIEALAYIHSKEMKHCDVKPDNFFLFEHLSLKISNFGHAKNNRVQNLTLNHVDTMGYMDPFNDSSPASDVFSWSMALVHVFTRRPPNSVQTPMQRVEDIRSCIDSNEMRYGLDDFLLCLNACCGDNVEKRPTSSEILSIMERIVVDNGQDPRIISNHALSGWITTMENKLTRLRSATGTRSSEFCMSSSTLSFKSSSISSSSNSCCGSSSSTYSSRNNRTNTSLNGKALKDLTNEECLLLLEDLGIPDVQEHCRKDFTGELLKSFNDIKDFEFIGLKDKELYTPFRMTKWLAALLKIQKQDSINTEKLAVENLEKNHESRSIEILELQKMYDEVLIEKQALQENYERLINEKNSQLENLLKWKSDIRKLNNQSLRIAVDLWFSNRAECEKIYNVIEEWDTSNVTDMKGLFRDRKEFNEDISKWNVSNVTTMNKMFSDASSFNQSLSTWNVSKVTNVAFMFSGASSFNQSLECWDKYPNMWIRNAIKLWLTDRSAAMKKYGNIEEWDTSNVTDMSYLLHGYGNTNFAIFLKSSFNEDISNWDVSKVTDMNSMFNGACSFNQSLSTWNVSNVTNMNCMFNCASSFNQSLSSWNVAKVTDMTDMFVGAKSFNISNNAPWYRKNNHSFF